MSKQLFKEAETLAGYITVHSGSLLLCDGVWDSSNLPDDSKINIDLEEDASLKIPVSAIRQNGKRFILIAIDSAVRHVPDSTKTVEIESDEDVPKDAP